LKAQLPIPAAMCVHPGKYGDLRQNQQHISSETPPTGPTVSTIGPNLRISLGAPRLIFRSPFRIFVLRRIV